MRDKPAPTHQYVITRLDLPHPTVTVQVAHAAIAATVAFTLPGSVPRHPNLVVLAVADESALDAAFNRLKELGVAACAFYEEDLNNQLTAVSTAPLGAAERKHLRQYKLLAAPPAVAQPAAA